MLFFYYYLSKNDLNLLGFIKIRGSESRQVHVYSTKLIPFNKIISLLFYSIQISQKNYKFTHKKLI